MLIEKYSSNFVEYNAYKLEVCMMSVLSLRIECLSVLHDNQRRGAKFGITNIFISEIYLVEMMTN